MQRCYERNADIIKSMTMQQLQNKDAAPTVALIDAFWDWNSKTNMWRPSCGRKPQNSSAQQIQRLNNLDKMRAAKQANKQQQEPAAELQPAPTLQQIKPQAVEFLEKMYQEHSQKEQQAKEAEAKRLVEEAEAKKLAEEEARLQKRMEEIMKKQGLLQSKTPIPPENVGVTNCGSFAANQAQRQELQTKPIEREIPQAIEQAQPMQPVYPQKNYQQEYMAKYAYKFK